MQNSFPQRRAAFTLVEILIVIAVIAILAAILFPVFARVRERGRTIACNSNMKQLGMAFQQYAQDANGKLPYAANFQKWTKGNAHWVAGRETVSLNTTPTGIEHEPTQTVTVEDGALFPYIKNAQVYVCPSTPDARAKKLGYSMNCAVGGIKDSRVRAPSDIVLLVDEGQSLNDGFFAAVDPATYASRDELTEYHNGGGNLLFFDGHVKFYSNDQFPTGFQTTAGDSNKTKLTGTPRFRDAAFGSPSASLPTSDFASQLNGTYFHDGKSSCDYR